MERRSIPPPYLSLDSPLGKRVISTDAIHKSKPPIERTPSPKTYQRQYKKGDSIYTAGDEPYGIIILNEGIARIQKVSSEGQQAIIAYVKGPSLLGEDALLERRTYAYSAEAKTPCVTTHIPNNQLLDLLQNEVLATELMKLIIARTAAQYEHAGYFITPNNGMAKVARYLIEALKENSVPIPQNQHEIAEYVGLDRMAVNKYILSLIKRRMVKNKRYARANMAILDESKLIYESRGARATK